MSGPGDDDPAIIINGHTLTNAQAMTVRVALGSFLMDLKTHGLGDDEHGRHMTEGYRRALVEIIRLMHPGDAL